MQLPAGPPFDTGDADEDGRIDRMAVQALAYIGSFGWSKPVARCSLAFGIGDVIALFLIDFTEPVDGEDARLWVVTGDLPSAYFVTDQAADALSGLQVYCDLMQGWAEAVLEGGALNEVFPVDADPTEANALMLQTRLTAIREHILPTLLPTL